MRMVDVVGARGRPPMKWGGPSARVCERKEREGNERIRACKEGMQG